MVSIVTRSVKGSELEWAEIDANFNNLNNALEALKYPVNDIGIQGHLGFGVGIHPNPPAGFDKYWDTDIRGSDHWGNYIYSDGSEMVYTPTYVYKWGTGSNGLAVNLIDTKPLTYFGTVAAANAAGYAMHRAFYNSGQLKDGVFVDKWLCSNNGGIASSIRYGLPLSSAADHNPFSGLNGAPANAYYGAIAAAKTRAANFFVSTRFIADALAMLALAQAQSSTSTTVCAWFDSTGVNNFPKGCNNNALGDANDATLAFVSGGYLNCAKTGSANVLAKTTHNGQNCGIADVNGNMWEIQPGITSDGTNFYLLNPSVDMAAVTGGNTLATDLWGATGIAAMYTSIGATYEALTASSTQKTFGSASQVFSEAVSGNAWLAACAGIPLLAGVGGANKFGNDGLWDYRPNEMCPLGAGSWNNSGLSGPWALALSNVRGNSSSGVGFRAALYP